MLQRTGSILLAGALAVLLQACSSLSAQQDDAVYQALGGKEGIGDIVAGMLYRIADDPRINTLFEDVDIGQLHGHLTAQFCELTGGPCVYEGRSMSESHEGLAIGETEFNALVEDLILAMEEADAPVWAQNRLLAKLAPMHQDIVQ